MTTKTPSTTSPRDPVAVARAGLEKQRSVLAKWEAQQVATEAELDSLQQRAGDEILDDPAAAGDLARSMQALRDRLDIARRAVAAQGPRVTKAEADYLNAEADVLERDAETARATLAAHQARTAELLAELEKHEGRFVPHVMLIEEQRLGGVVGAPTSWEIPKSAALVDAVMLAELRVTVLRDLAAGQDPAPRLRALQSIRDGRIQGVRIDEIYPSCVRGPDAVVPA